LDLGFEPRDASYKLSTPEAPFIFLKACQSLNIPNNW
jgi:hypothetical protein